MLSERILRSDRTNTGRTGVVAALCLALATAPLVGCGGQKPADDGGASAPVAQGATVDVTSWKTMSDALAAQTESMAAGWNENYYVTIFRAGDQIVRVVCELDADTAAKMEAVDWSRDDVSEQMEQAVGSAPLKSAEDITAELKSPEELAELAGKTGRELVDAGWTFESYDMYGGEQTGAVMSFGNFAYSLTFDVMTPEDKIEDEGSSVMDAKVVEAAFQGASDAGTSPENVK